VKCYRLRWTHPDSYVWIYSVVSYDLISAQERLAKDNLPDAEIVRVKPGTDEVLEVL
jgi:hypothetical protein